MRYSTILALAGLIIPMRRKTPLNGPFLETEEIHLPIPKIPVRRVNRLQKTGNAGLKPAREIQTNGENLKMIVGPTPVTGDQIDGNLIGNGKILEEEIPETIPATRIESAGISREAGALPLEGNLNVSFVPNQR